MDPVLNGCFSFASKKQTTIFGVYGLSPLFLKKTGASSSSVTKIGLVFFLFFLQEYVVLRFCCTAVVVLARVH